MIDLGSDPQVLKYKGLVLSIAKRYSTYPDDFPDLVQAGMLGLLKAIDSYSKYKKTKLSTWVFIHARAEIQKLKNNELVVKISPVTAFKHKIQLVANDNSNETVDEVTAYDNMIEEEQARKDATRFFKVWAIMNKRFTSLERSILLDYFQEGLSIRKLDKKYDMNCYPIIVKVKQIVQANHLSSTSS